MKLSKTETIVIYSSMMQGILAASSADDKWPSPKSTAEKALWYGDALIEALEQKEQSESESVNDKNGH